MRRDLHDLAGGVVLTGIGLAVAAYAATRWQIGTPRRMGPGFFPAGLGGLLALLGLAIAVPAWGRAGVASRVALPELAAVLSAVVIFAVGLEWLGLVTATAAAVLVSSVAAPRAGWVWRLALSAAVTLIAVAVFHLGLNMSVPLWPQPR